MDVCSRSPCCCQFVTNCFAFSSCLLVLFLSFQRDCLPSREHTWGLSSTKCELQVSELLAKLHNYYSLHLQVAANHQKKLVGKKIKASSPNGRFKEGAAIIDGKTYCKIIAVGKNLFAFFGKSPNDPQCTVVHVHFGMSGRWSIFLAGQAPAVKETTRLVLSDGHFEAHLSAMTVAHGSLDMYHSKRAMLGLDPLDPEVQESQVVALVQRAARKRTISQLLMDQALFAGVGNIYRAEILFASRLDPRTRASSMSVEDIVSVWRHSVRLMQMGRESGRIICVTDEEQRMYNMTSVARRRFVYNQTHCAVCTQRISSWKESSRTVWACLHCQKNPTRDPSPADTPTKESVSAIFNSHCASEPLELRLQTPQKLTCQELRQALRKYGAGAAHDVGVVSPGRAATMGVAVASPLGPKNLAKMKKPELVRRYSELLQDASEHTADFDANSDDAAMLVPPHGYQRRLSFQVAAAAAVRTSTRAHKEDDALFSKVASVVSPQQVSTPPRKRRTRKKMRLGS